MRLLSFCNLVETAMDMIQPVHAKGWNRRAIYQLGNATYWNPKLGLTLTLACCSLKDGCCSIQTCWHGPSGEVLQTRVFFCGTSQLEWQRAAETVAEIMPDPARLASAVAGHTQPQITTPSPAFPV